MGNAALKAGNRRRLGSHVSPELISQNVDMLRIDPSAFFNAAASTLTTRSPPLEKPIQDSQRPIQGEASENSYHSHPEAFLQAASEAALNLSGPAERIKRASPR
jgi:hypothetical protein